ncbi:MAG: hypothetical protein ABIO36_01325 [Pyrinomonadaceae bacterium]
MQNTLFIVTSENFSFRATVYSHGWCELAPFDLDLENWRLGYIFRDKKNQAVPAVISEEEGKIRIELSSAKVDAEDIIADTRHLLRLDDDLAGFYDSIIGHDRLNWVGERRAGRMLRSASVFEDLVKTICTTNCSWALTKSMVSNLVEKLGTAAASGKKAFPTPEAMASVSSDFYREQVRTGYRSPYFVELADAVASGKLNPQDWLTSDLPTAELKKEMKKVKGVGDYAAENLLKLVGRYDGLALDSWLRSQFYKNHNNDKPCPDKKIERYYKEFGSWRGLVIWCDMTEKWVS